MPTYKYNGKVTYINSLMNLKVEPGETVETRYILDDIDGFERISDEPAPYADYSEDYVLNPGEKVEITKDMYEGLNTITAFKIADKSSDTKAYLYIDSENNKTDAVIDNVSYATVKFPLYRRITKIILKADESNSQPITVRVSFGYDFV